MIFLDTGVFFNMEIYSSVIEEYLHIENNIQLFTFLSMLNGNTNVTDDGCKLQFSKEIKWKGLHGYCEDIAVFMYFKYSKDLINLYECNNHYFVKYDNKYFDSYTNLGVDDYRHLYYNILYPINENTVLKIWDESELPDYYFTVAKELKIL